MGTASMGSCMLLGKKRLAAHQAAVLLQECGQFAVVAGDAQQALDITDSQSGLPSFSVHSVSEPSTLPTSRPSLVRPT